MTLREIELGVCFRESFKEIFKESFMGIFRESFRGKYRVDYRENCIISV
ncbi:hypothetical protein [Xenorhabdus sp. IM139775]|nr:hypothetical protein [Xenorhabdus sp. IM139775]MDC9592879.1 hypothetical protein [Xenorhabdus sp. IM139775]